MSDASKEVPVVVESVNVMEWNSTLAPSMVNTFLLSLTLITLFETDPEHGLIVYSVVVDVNDVAVTSSV